ncbi:MAG: DUF5716 family protein [Kineothrix sp.]
MLLDRKPGSGKKNGGQAVIGYDLSDDYAQITYCIGREGKVETLALVAGTERYNIPAVLWKKKGVNQWLFGKEALEAADEEGGTRVDRLVSLARSGEPVRLEEESFDPVALLTLFVKKSLSLLDAVASSDSLGGVMFTLDDLDERMGEVMTLLGANLHLRTEQIFFQSHAESFYYYMLQQPEELWNCQVLLCDYDNRRLKVYELGCNRKTQPKVVCIDSFEYKEMAREGIVPPSGSRQKEELDRSFQNIVSERCGSRAVSCVYLVGEGYRDGWMARSLRYLCRSSRVFRGNNLYSKGACCSIREKLGLGQHNGEYVFLGRDKLKTNIGMRVFRKGEESFFTILDGGISWFEAKKDFDLILESGDTISLRLVPLIGKGFREIHMRLEGLAERPAWTTRLRIQIRMQSEQRLCVRVKDMGFGEIFPSSGGEWMKMFDIG